MRRSHALVKLVRVSQPSQATGGDGPTHLSWSRQPPAAMPIDRWGWLRALAENQVRYPNATVLFRG
eukprot:12400649-Karenia_brevis.AAC.1